LEGAIFNNIDYRYLKQIMTKWLIRILVTSAAFDAVVDENMKNYNSSEEN
jgi:hypothetical protein